MEVDTDRQIRNGLLEEHSKLLKKISKWRSETVMYRWLNIFLFMSCKIFVPTGALVIAVNMISIVLERFQ